MAQALVAGRAEQAYLEDRLKVNERRVEQLRRETLLLRSVLERWHGDFVVSALQVKQVEYGTKGGLNRAQVWMGPQDVFGVEVLSMFWAKKPASDGNSGRRFQIHR